MTKEQIEKMEAGRASDLCIMERIFKGNPRDYDIYTRPSMIMTDPTGKYKYIDVTFKKLPAYSTEIAPAFEVVEKIKNSRAEKEDGNFLMDWCGYGWMAGFYQYPDSPTIYGEADTLPLAICRAALLATKEKTK